MVPLIVGYTIALTKKLYINHKYITFRKIKIFLNKIKIFLDKTGLKKSFKKLKVKGRLRKLDKIHSACRYPIYKSIKQLALN